MGFSIRVLCAAKLHRNQLERHLELFEYIPEVERVTVVRRQPLPGRLSKLKNESFNPGPLPIEMLRLFRGVERVCHSESVDWFLGFNPVPWGSLGAAAARRAGAKVCLSLIGMDFLQIQKRLGYPFLLSLRAADAVTVTGNSMKLRLEELGVEGRRIFVLPHSVDLVRFGPSMETPVFDVLAVGQLIERKRLDVLIDALALLKSRGVVLRAGILGKGPLEQELFRRAASKGVAQQVEFLGYRDHVEEVLRQARIFCLPSEWEGVPFALMEAMATGLVPVMTRVGTIEDWIVPGKTGYLTPVGDVAALARALEHAAGSEGEMIRQRLRESRERLGLKAGVDVWRQIFGLEVEVLPLPDTR